ncbi:unnamed protein product, partial [Rotaria sp. Silwood1]
IFVNETVTIGNVEDWITSFAFNRQSVFTFLNVSESITTIDRTRLEQLRSDYVAVVKTLPKATTTTTDNHNDPLKMIAEKFMLVDDPINLDHLNLCVSCSSLDVA